MPIQTASNASVLIRPNVSGGVVDVVSRPVDLFKFFVNNGLVRPSNGSSPFKWNVQTATVSSAETFVEDQALGQVGRRTMVQASVSATYFRATAQVTGHFMDNAMNGGLYDPNAVTAEIQNATMDLTALVDSTLRGSTADIGLLTVVDAADVYAGLNPSSTSQWDSVEEGTSPMDFAHWQTFYLDQTTPGHNGSPSVYLIAPAGKTKYDNLGGPGSSAFRVQLGQTGYDMGIQNQVSSFNSVPLVPIKSFDANTVMGLDLTTAPGDMGGFPGVCLVIHRDMRVDQLAKVNDNAAKSQVSLALGVRVAARNRQGKMAYS